MEFTGDIAAYPGPPCIHCARAHHVGSDAGRLHAKVTAWRSLINDDKSKEEARSYELVRNARNTERAKEALQEWLASLGDVESVSKVLVGGKSSAHTTRAPHPHHASKEVRPWWRVLIKGPFSSI